jgi:hypothetical protein
MTDMTNAARPLIPREPAVADLPQSPSAAYAQGWREGWIEAWRAARDAPKPLSPPRPSQG